MEQGKTAMVLCTFIVAVFFFFFLRNIRKTPGDIPDLFFWQSKHADSAQCKSETRNKKFVRNFLRMQLLSVSKFPRVFSRFLLFKQSGTERT